MSEPQITMYWLEPRCPLCGHPLYSDGRHAYCSGCEYGHDAPVPLADVQPTPVFGQRQPGAVRYGDYTWEDDNGD